MGSIESMEPDDPRRIGEELRQSGVELVGEISESELGELVAPEAPDQFADEGGDELYREDDGDYLAAAREAGEPAREAGVDHVGGLSEADLGSLTPPETPRPESETP